MSVVLLQEMHKIYLHSNLACALPLHVTTCRSIVFLPKCISCPFHKSWFRSIQLQSQTAPPILSSSHLFQSLFFIFPFQNLPLLTTLLFLLHTYLGLVLRSDLCALIETKINIPGNENLGCEQEEVEVKYYVF